MLVLLVLGWLLGLALRADRWRVGERTAVRLEEDMVVFNTSLGDEGCSLHSALEVHGVGQEEEDGVVLNGDPGSEKAVPPALSIRLDDVARGREAYVC